MPSAKPVVRSLLAASTLSVTAAVSLAQEEADLASRRPLAIDDYFRIASVAEPQVSPDGELVAYTVGTSDLEQDETETAIWVVASSGGEAVRWTAPGYSASEPRFSPDGKYLSFLAARDAGSEDAEGAGETQVWAFRRQGGDAQPLTDVRQGVEHHEWSPTGSRLLLTIKDRKLSEEAKGVDEEKETPEPWVIDRLQFKRDYAGYLDNRRTHLYVYRLADGTLTQITSGDYDDSAGAWSPDGRLVAFASNRSEEPDGNDNSDIWIVSADTTDAGKTLRQVTTNPGSDASPTWSPDGTQLAYLTQVEPERIWYATLHLAVVPAHGGPPRLLTRSLDRNVSSPRFTGDGRSILFLLEDSAESQLARISLTGKKFDRLVADGAAVQAFSITPNGGRVAYIDSNANRPSEIFLFEPGATATRLTHIHDELLAEVKSAEVRNVTFTSSDGIEIEGFITLPLGYDSRLTYPTILRIHGGPVSQYDSGFDFQDQLFAAHGYVVVKCNPRGSSGYGQDFSLGIWQSWGDRDFDDVMAAVDYAVREGYADPTRLGVGGWSYGGILTNYVITQTDRFKGAITGASEVLYVSNYGHDHYQLEWEKELGLPWENRELWERLSPFNQVERVTTPTLVMGGEKDWNVPILNSEQLYQALRRLGRTTQLVVYPDEHHGIRRPTFQKDRLERYLAWYDEHVKGSAESQP